MQKEVKIFVNLEKAIATIQIIKRVPLFDGPAKRFIIEMDHYGFSAIEKRDNNYYLVNYLEKTKIHDEQLTPDEAKLFIKKVLEEREKERA
jgi:hypothetical protein